MSKKQIFWCRVAVWVLFAAIVPLGIITWQFNLFQTNTQTTTTIRFGGWGVVCAIIAFFVIRSAVNYVKKGLPYSVATQMLNGFVKVILPLSTITFVGYILMTTFSQGLEQFMIVMGTMIVSEAIAIPVNPLPQWAYQKNIERHQDVAKGVFETVLDTLDERKKNK